ncbi:MAG TPA: DNA-formamidopyrimidine glycosylase family protein [Pyrinomonadaceae bacterium]
MPELPDITIYLEALETRILDHPLERILLNSPFLIRTAHPPIASLQGRKVVALRRLGKRICIGMQNDLWIVLHLMIGGRLQWKTAIQAPGKARSSSKYKATLATFEFDNGLLTLTEAGTQRRASLHLVEGEAGLRALDPGGVELFQQTDRQEGLGAFINLADFTRVLKSENHTLKRALTDPHLFSGIGNAYSDEILWAARLSPVKLTQKLSDAEVEQLHAAVRGTLTEWVGRLRTETGEAFPEKVTAFREGMAMHGRYREPCPRCGAKVQRIRYAANETNYCPRCQTGGKLLADRALSRILRDDWPKTAEGLE